MPLRFMTYGALRTITEETEANTLYQEFLAQEGQTLFVLGSSYHVGYNTLRVYENGVLLRIHDDYEEIDERTIRLLHEAELDAKYTFIEKI